MKDSKNITMKKSNQELITTNQADIICDALANGKTLTEILEDQKQYPFSLMKFYHYLKKNPELANKLTDLYSDNKPIKQNIDQKMTISWENTEDNMIDVSEDVTDITPPDNKD